MGNQGFLKQSMFLLLGILIGILVFIGIRMYQMRASHVLHERFVVTKASEGVRMLLLRQETRRAQPWFLMFVQDTENPGIAQHPEQGKTFFAVPCGRRAYLVKFDPFQEVLTVDGRALSLAGGRIFLMDPQRVEQIETTPVFEQTLLPAITMQGGIKGAEALKTMVTEIRQREPKVNQFFEEAAKEAASRPDGGKSVAPVYTGPPL